MSNDIPAPRYEHDCKSCIHLDSREFEGAFCDMYFCPRCDDGTLIARFSSEGSDYTSYPLFVWEPRRKDKITRYNNDGTVTFTDDTLAQVVPQIEHAYQIYLTRIKNQGGK